jgi:hypothetical protein
MTNISADRRWVTGRTAGLLLSCALMAGPVMATASDPAATPAQWRTQKLEFTYSGFTAFYTCEGLESKVRYVLLAFGARPDAKVQAIGCDRAQNQPNKIAWIQAEFSSLAPATDASANDAVAAVWTKVQLAPHKPTNMGMGECELVEQMRPMLEKGFSLRNTDYQTSCVPKQMSVADYNVRAEVLQALAH